MDLSLSLPLCLSLIEIEVLAFDPVKQELDQGHEKKREKESEQVERHRGKERDRAGASNIWTTDTYHKLLFFSLQFSLPFLLKPLFLFRLTGPGSMRGNEILYEVRHEISRA